MARINTGLLIDGKVVDAWREGNVFYDAPKGGTQLWPKDPPKKAEKE